jgi:hypothetical protein
MVLLGNLVLDARLTPQAGRKQNTGRSGTMAVGREDRQATLAFWSSSVLAGHDQAPFLSASPVAQDPSLPLPQPSQRPMLFVTERDDPWTSIVQDTRTPTTFWMSIRLDVGFSFSDKAG